MSANHKGYLGIYEFARETGHSVKHIYEQIRLGKLPAKKMGRKWQIPKSELAQR
jgi:excisionase family DNA binding protein